MAKLFSIIKDIGNQTLEFVVIEDSGESKSYLIQDLTHNFNSSSINNKNDNTHNWHSPTWNSINRESSKKILEELIKILDSDTISSYNLGYAVKWNKITIKQ